MTEIIELLDRLNRKERFFVVGQALGNPTFTPASEFLELISKSIGFRFPPPELVRCFMDYHFDWIYAALTLGTSEGHGPFPSPEFVPTVTGDPPWNVNTNQEDVDLLLAFNKDAVTHLVMIEAKAATGWRLDQVLSKVRRMERIFGHDGQLIDGVRPHFVLLSPVRSAALDQELARHEVPTWLRPTGRLPWVELDWPDERMTISRCDAAGIPAKAGDHWMALSTTVKVPPLL